MVELSIFYKLEEKSSQTVRPIKIKTAATVLVAFTVLWERSHFIRSKYFSKIGQDRGEKCLADQDRKLLSYLGHFA